MNSPWFWIFLVLFMLMPIRFAIACIMYGPREALRKVAGFWFGYLLFAIAGTAVFIGVVKIVGGVTQSGFLTLIAIFVALAGYFCCIGWGMRLWESLREKLFGPPSISNEDQEITEKELTTMFEELSKKRPSQK